jgi:hypothetical protein
MGTYSNGIIGSFNGRVGAVVGVMWKGKNVMRSRPKKRTAPLTSNEIRHRVKFALVNNFLKNMIDLVNYSFHSELQHQSGYNKAFSYIIKNAVVLKDSKPFIDYSMVLLSKGDLPKPESLMTETSESGKIIFSWKDNSGKGQARSSDLAFMSFYNEENNIWFGKEKVAERSQEKCEFYLPAEYGGLELQTYFGFVSANEKESCDSVYGVFVFKK